MDRLAIQFLHSAVGGGRDDKLSRASLDLGDVEMEQANYPPSCWLAARLTRTVSSDREKTFFIKRKKSLSLMPCTFGATRS